MEPGELVAWYLGGLGPGVALETVVGVLTAGWMNRRAADIRRRICG